MNEQFTNRQREFFNCADDRHFWWQTTNPYVARTERELLSGLIVKGHVLEVGRGEGGNIINTSGIRSSKQLHAMNTAEFLATLSSDQSDSLNRQAIVTGLDLFERKLVFADRQHTSARFVCGDAVRLPFSDSSFDLVLCRDVLHHLTDREGALREIRRVCKPGGKVWIIEPNGRNPLIRLLAFLRPHERGLLRNSISSLRQLVKPHFPSARFEARQPMPLFRVILHYQLGIPALGYSRIFARVMDVWDAFARRTIPRGFWAYVLIVADI